MTTVAAVDATPRRPSRFRRLGAGGSVGLFVIVVLGAVAILAPVLPLKDPTDVDVVNRFAPLSRAHWLGTDSNGRDIMARLLWGSRTALLGPLAVTFAAAVIGVGLAIFAAWRGGWVDAAIARLFDITFAFPGILLALVAGAVFGIGLKSAVIALTIAYVPYIGRITRAAALQQVRMPYVAALTVQGQSGFAICRRHLLPNLSRIVLAQATVTFGYALVDLAALSFLGLGVSQNTADWGVMVAGGQSEIISGHPHQAIVAGIAIVIAVIAFTVVGERLGDGDTKRGGALL